MTASTQGRRGTPTAAVAVAAFFALVVMGRSTLPLVDGDVWWHLRAGEEILRSGAVPATDAWTIAGQGRPWISQDWLSNVVMAAVHGAGGEWGATLLSLVFALVTVAAFALLWRGLGYRRGAPGWLARLVWLTAGLIVAGPIIGVRVQTLDLLLSAATAWLLWGYLGYRSVTWLTGLPLVALAWVNLHAGFPLLFLLGGAVIVGEAVDRVLARAPDGVPLTWPQIGRLTGALAVAGAVLILNPNGPRIYTYPFATAAIAAHRDFLFEWSTPDLSTFPGQVLIAFLVLVVAPTLWMGRRHIRTAHALWLVGLSLMSIMAIRFALLAGPIGGALAAIHLAPQIASWPAWHGLRQMAHRMSLAPREGIQANLNAILVLVVIAAGGILALARAAPAVQAQAIAANMPVAATAWLRADGSAKRIFNVYAWGGYLGRELPDTLVFIDGRSDIYGDAPIRRFADAIDLRSDPGALLTEARIDHVVFWPDSALGRWLDDQPAWERVHTDDLAGVWARRT
jgi:hypothetical protein